MKKIILLLILFISCIANSQTLYWVGGSGNLNDKQHWSLTSGGLSAGISPSLSTDLIFDNNASFNTCVVNLFGTNHIKSLQCFSTDQEIHLTGDNFSSLNCHGDFILNEKIIFDASSNLNFSSNSSSFKNVNFWKNIINTTVLFEEGNWNLISVKVGDNNTLKFNKGTYNVTNASVVAGNLVANSGHVIFNSIHSTFHTKHKVTLGQDVSFNSTDLMFIAHSTVPSLYDVNSQVNFGSNSKIINPAPQACAISYSFTNPSCSNSCDGSITIGISGCGPGPFNITFNTAATCIPSNTTGISPPTLTFSNLCGCGGNLLDIFMYDALGNLVANLNGLQMPSLPTPINSLFSSNIPVTCNGLCNGSVKIAIIGGVSPYTVVVDPLTPGPTFTTNAFTQNPITALCFGVHTYSVTDNNGCTKTFTNAINQPAVLLANGSSSSITCNGFCTGSGTVSPTGGNGGNVYTWTSGVPTNTLITSSLCVGNVTCTIVDSKSCTATYTTNIQQPPATTVAIVKTNLNCAGVCNGTATITVTGGTPAYTYSLNGVSSASVITGLCAANYTVNIKDTLGCITTRTFVITSPPLLITAPTKTNVTCNGTSTGTINLNPSGGTPGVLPSPPYTYVWSPAGPNSAINPTIPAGVYSYTVTDALGCTTASAVTITQPTSTTLTVTKTDIACFGLTNGSATITPSGGTSPFSYTWTPTPPLGQGTATISGLSAGTYSASVKDANGCLTNTTVTITQPTSVTVTTATTQPTCSGLLNGSIAVTATGGVGSNTFSLSPAVSSTPAGPTFLGLGAGSYTVTVANGSGCVTTKTVVLGQPNPITLTLTATPLACFGDVNSSITANVGGGTPTYMVNWTPAATGLVLPNQGAGIKTATVTDAGGCTATASLNLTSPTSLTVNVSATALSCSSSTNAIATATALGGTPGYTYTWTPTNYVGNPTTNMGPGSYTVTVTDNAGCIKTQTINIVAPPALTLTTTNGTVACSGSCTGTVGVTATGGTAGYTYNWNSSPAQFTPTTTATLCNGPYAVTVTDSKGCVVNAGASVTQPPTLLASITGIKPSCNACIGAATVTPSGGASGYTYAWTNSVSVVVSTSQTASNLCVGFYTVTVGDANGCTTTATVQIVPSVVIVITVNNNVLQCNGGTTGVAVATPTSGISPYTYVWSPTGPPTQTTQTAVNLGAGTYTVLVTDSQLCSNTATVSFVDPPVIVATVSHTDETCFGFCNGTASVTASGGTGALVYQWLPGGQTTTGISGLCAGNYTVNVTDANNCVQSRTVQISSAVNITTVFTYTSPSSCTLANGAINASISGGSAPYTLTWTPGNSNANPLTNLSGGNYNLTVKDLAGCTQTYVATLNSLTGPTITASSSSLTCFGQSNATATVTAVGVATLTYSWTSGATPTSSIATGLSSGTVAVSVTDGNSCVTNTIVTIASPTQLTATGLVTNINCNGTSTGSINLTPSGGTPTYTYNWSPTGGNVQDPINLPAGTYTGVTTDANGCSVSSTFTITQPPILTLSFNKKDVSCFGGCTGSVRAVVAGGTGPYSYLWSPGGSIIDTIVNLCTGIYTVNVIDSKGCAINGTVVIGQPTAALTSTITSTNMTCNGICNGTASLTASGGTSPYFFNWNTTPASPTPSVGGLCVGNYQGTVTDANGCTSVNTTTITQPTAITITVTPNAPKCVAACNGSFTAVIAGGTPGSGYTCQWIPVAAPTNTLQNPTGLCAGNYTLIVTDNNACTQQTITSLTDPPVLLANVSFTNPVCNGFCNGIAASNPVGGTGGYTYSWQSPAQSTQTITNLCPGIYTVVVTDANLCTDTKTVSLVNPVAISVNPVGAPATCGVNNGSIDASSVTGTGPFTYSWSSNVPAAQLTFSIVTGIPAGVYTVVVTSTSSGCTASAIIPLNSANGPTVATISSTNVTCNGLCNGTAIVSNAGGGTPSYTYTWINPASATATISNLCSGTYTAQVTDTNNCLFFPAVMITEPLILADNATITNAQCFGICNGSVVLNPSGGNGGYTYSWSPGGATTSSVTNLCPGPITTTITDVGGCKLVKNYNLPSITTITSNTVATNNVCFGSCNGSVLVTNIAGGLAPYTVLWNNGQTNTTATGLCNGSYTAAITDASGCVGSNSASITSNPQVVITSTLSQPSCNACNGSATITPTGSGVYTYVWSNTQTTNPVTGLCAGVYGVQITDTLGCVTNTNVVINNSSGITGDTITQANETCAAACNGTVTVGAVGGVAPITYNWVHNNSTSPTQVGLCAGTYFCNMIDANGCSLTASVVIGSAASLTVTSQVSPSSCTVSTGSITATVSGGAGPYSYTWLPAALGTASVVTNLTPGIYTLTVADFNLCSKTQTYTINSFNGPVITSTVINTNCSSAILSGSIGISISAGTPTYTILWSDGITTGNSFSGLGAGSYSVSVTDNAGCVAVQGYSISGSTPIIFSAPNLNNPKCFNDCNGSITAIPLGGTLPFTYSWSPSTPTAPTTSSLCSGPQTVTITDSKGCIGTQTYVLTNPAVLGFTASVLSPTCSTTPNGSISITPFGGTPNYTYAWTGGTISSSQNLFNIIVGTYSLSMTDANGCKKDTFIVMTSTLVVDAIAGRDTVFCQNVNLTLNGSSSIGGVTYDWFQLPLLPAISNTLIVSVNPPVGTSTYVLVATNGSCVDRDTIKITSNALPIVDAGPFVNIPINTTSPIGGAPTSPSLVTYTWTPNFGTLDNYNIANPIASNTVSTHYTITVTDANGCTNFDTVSVIILPQIKIPNGFSPNADGKNDVWQIDYLYQFPDNVVEVYNRWGELLFMSKGYAVPFDGKYNGKDLPVGTYYYIIDLHSATYPKPYTGPLTIFR